MGTGLASILRTWYLVQFCQRSTVDCRQPFGCATSFSIQIWIRSIYLRDGLTVVRGPSAVDIFFVNGPQSTVGSRSVVPHRLASILRTWPARRGGYLVQSTVVCRPSTVDIFFVNGPLLTVDSCDVVLHKFASKYGYGLFIWEMD